MKARGERAHDDGARHPEQQVDEECLTLWLAAADRRRQEQAGADPGKPDPDERLVRPVLRPGGRRARSPCHRRQRRIDEEIRCLGCASLVKAVGLGPPLAKSWLTSDLAISPRSVLIAPATASGRVTTRCVRSIPCRSPSIADRIAA